jgi:Na+/H+-dicarboxylate symporter
VNTSSIFVKSSARNLSSFLKKEVINPLSVSANSVQVIKEGNVIYEYAGQAKYNSANLLGVLVLSIVFGIILNGMGEKGKPIANLFNCLFHLLMELVQMIIWYAKPIMVVGQ